MLYAVTYQTESGDEGFVGVFDERPTEGHLSAITMRDYPDEVLDGESYISYAVHAVTEIEHLPDPIAPILGI